MPDHDIRPLSISGGWAIPRGTNYIGEVGKTTFIEPSLKPRLHCFKAIFHRVLPFVLN